MENGNLRVYKYHPNTGEYVGNDEADPSPLEKEVFLIPANATEVAPPEPKEGKFRKFNGKEWVYEDIPKEVEETVDLAQEARERRNWLLASSDWRILPDVPAKHSAGYTMYRQALRDVPQQKEFPEKINWPKEPKA